VTGNLSDGGDMLAQVVSRQFFQRRIVLLDPMMPAPRVVAHAPSMANSILAPQSGPRLAPRPPMPALTSGFLGGETAQIAIATSPLSGLVDWALPLN
jgi:hypothetical protein